MIIIFTIIRLVLLLLLYQKKQARLQWLQDQSEINGDLWIMQDVNQQIFQE
jgi:hypothetical protein